MTEKIVLGSFDELNFSRITMLLSSLKIQNGIFHAKYTF